MRKFVAGNVFLHNATAHKQALQSFFTCYAVKTFAQKYALQDNYFCNYRAKNFVTNPQSPTNLAGSFRNDGAQNVCKRQNAPVFNSIIIYSQTSFVNSSYPSPDTAKRMLTCENCFKMCLTNELLRHLQNAGKFQTSGKHRLMLPPLSTATKWLSVSKLRQATTAGKVLTFPTTTIFISTKKGRNVSIPPRFSYVTLPCNLRCFQ